MHSTEKNNCVAKEIKSHKNVLNRIYDKRQTRNVRYSNEKLKVKINPKFLGNIKMRFSPRGERLEIIISGE